VVDQEDVDVAAPKSKNNFFFISFLGLIPPSSTVMIDSQERLKIPRSSAPIRIFICTITIFISISLFLTGCTNTPQLDEQQTWRINSLYEHTLQMKDISKPQTLKEIQLDISILKPSNQINVIEKIEILEKSFKVNKAKNIEQRIINLENKMNDMMTLWAQLETNTQQFDYLN
jgi:hypothetical protein